MSRWRVLTLVGSAALVLGCSAAEVPPAEVAQRVTPGLSNVPRLYGAEATNDEPPQDVVSNGPESCGRDGDHGVLRGQWPRCPSQEPQASTAAAGVADSWALDPNNAALVVPLPARPLAEGRPTASHP
jgi:hypothetical protein